MEERDAVGACLGDERLAGGRQHRQGEAVAAVGAQHAGGHVLDGEFGLAVNPAAVERTEIAGNAEQAVAFGAVALGARHVLGQQQGHVVGAAVAAEHRGEQVHQFVVVDPYRHGPIFGQVSESR